MAGTVAESPVTPKTKAVKAKKVVEESPSHSSDGGTPTRKSSDYHPSYTKMIMKSILDKPERKGITAVALRNHMVGAYSLSAEPKIILKIVKKTLDKLVKESLVKVADEDSIAVRYKFTKSGKDQAEGKKKKKRTSKAKAASSDSESEKPIKKSAEKKAKTAKPKTPAKPKTTSAKSKTAAAKPKTTPKQKAPAKEKKPAQTKTPVKKAPAKENTKKAAKA